MANRFAKYVSAPQLAYPIDQPEAPVSVAPQSQQQNRFAKYLDRGGGLSPDASPVDFSNQSAMASQQPQQLSPNEQARGATFEARGGYLDKMQGQGIDLGQAPAPQAPAQARPGDMLKPAFGGHNPVAEIFDNLVEPFLPGNQPPPDQPPEPGRPLLDRAAGLAATVGSMPVRLATQGQKGLGDVIQGAGDLTSSPMLQGAGQAVSGAEQDFAQANAPQLEALKTAGDWSMGAFGLPPMSAPGTLRRAPAPTRVKEPRLPGSPPPIPSAPGVPAAPPSTAGGPMTLPSQGGYQLPVQPQMMSQPSSGPARARAYVGKLDDLGISRFGPAIAQASREGNDAGNVTKVIEGFPIVSRPITQGRKDFLQSASSSANRIADEYSPVGNNPEAAGASGRGYFDRFKNERTIDRDDFANMSDAEVHRLATTPPREIGSLKTALDARYEDAWREIPERFRRGGTEEDHPSLKANMANTRALLQDIVDDNLRMMNRQRLDRRSVHEETPDALPTRQDTIPKPAIPFRGGVLGTAIEDILGGSWNGSLQTMRNLRSMIRRQNSKIADNEGNVLSKSQLTRLHGAISQDMTALMERISRQYRQQARTAAATGDTRTASEFNTLATSYERAARKMRAADRFTARYAEAMDAVKKLTGAAKDYDVISAIRSAALAKGGNSNLLMQIRRMAPPEVLDDLASGVLNDMWRPTGAATGAAQDAGLSIGKFATQWNNMSPQARQLIFGHRPELYQRLNKFADVAQGMADWEKLANTSRSGTHGLIGTMLLAGPNVILGNLWTGMITAGAVYGMAHWLTSPGYIAWLTRSLKIQKAIDKGNLSPVAARAATSRHVARLRELVSKDRELSAENASALFQTLGLDAPSNGDRQPPDVQQ
jgi:hypothetical protein